MTAASIPGASLDPVTFNPYDYDFHEDPYVTYRRLREEAPVYYNPELDFWALSRHEDVVAAFRDSARLSSANGVSLDPAAYGPKAYKTMSFLALDDPRHMRMRQLVSRGFTPRRVNELHGRIEELTTKYLDPALASGEFDWISEFAGMLPMDVISELMGVPETDRSELRRLADLVVHREEGVLDVPQAAMEASLYLVGYYADMIAERRKKPADDLTSALLEAEIDGDRLTDDEIIAFMFLMVVAGNETTTKLLGNALYWGSRFPDEARKVLGDPSRVPEWVEETLRYDTSSQMVARTAAVDVSFRDTTIAAGDKVLILIGSANRDPAVFEDADEYRIGRDTSNKLASFGGGTHFCLGAHMARLEAKIALTQLVEKVENFEVDESSCVRVHSTNVRGFASLPLKVQVRHA
ncbi:MULTISPECIES: cytochrome P450 [Rhodococcus]|uniref:Cytochrome P450 n=1 Tax=Rhodococcus oxybenzonivorans TaxID=1990687 RepID=A0AAE4V190_9NOCA|nr:MULTISPECIES: cytochrome P450 [Rhodococcus]MDV7241067.1 cytochrome P450 [Rhodococcus oxybenzonivorans]MDV7266254.1 cytochrome P450 [Rhodococcus oxybenzonivorans]MDV7273340.1 cytochrome P450 [Rhodococcus oxybenzonivorans]MDV7332922.1 cytochrome P450 [Rhodococcus oxybenzonivorans]MDV7342088.1 cytochrome P450 [Rhodococcus oxybenzonivorans]